jgi:hypothetical protein
MRYFSILIIAIFIASCGAEDKVEIEIDTQKINRSDLYAEGKRLMENKCYVCHNPNVKEKHLIAPPLVDVKSAYYTEDEDKFVASITAFLNGPDKANSKLPAAVEKYGLMPYQRYDSESIRKIALYMYNNKIQEPEWWKGEQKGANELANNSEGEKSYADIGLEFALSTKQVLGANLMGTIQREGVLAAVDFCNTAAYPLTDSMSQVHNATIKRISDKPRNEKNKATKEDLPYLNKYKSAVAHGKEFTPTVIEENNSVTFYHPIITNDKCLLCHGTKENIEKNVLTAIQDRYPNDMATGYNANEVRGLWKISFDK